MSHGLAPNDKRRQLYKEAREALSRIEFTDRDWLWLRKMDEMGGRRTFVEPVGGANTRASLALDTHERRLMVKVLRRAQGPEGYEAPRSAEANGPLSLTLAEWSGIRVELLRRFFKTSGKSKEGKLERLITRIEDLITSEQAPDKRAEAPAACPPANCGALKRPPPPARTPRAGETQRVRRRRSFRFPGRGIGSLRELGLAMLLDDEGPLPAWMLHADGTLLASLARRGVIAVQPGYGEGDAVWMLTAEGRSETHHCRQLYMNWLERTHAKNPRFGRKQRQSPLR